jgi:hypothetical protein
MALTDLISNVGAKASYKTSSNVIGSTDTTTKQMLALLQTVNQELMESYAWPGLMKAATVTLVASQAEYDVPADFSYYHYDTFWNQSSNWQMYGALTNQEYADIKGFAIDVTLPTKFIIRGLVNKKIEITPVPTASEAGQTIYYLYHSARYVRPRTWAAGQSVSSGDYTQYNNNFYISATTGTTGATPPTHTTGSASDGTVSWAFTDNPYQSFINNNDSPVLPQRILEQGLLEAYNDQKGLEYTPRFDEMVMNELRRQKPGNMIAASNAPHRFTFGANSKFHFGTIG